MRKRSLFFLIILIFVLNGCAVIFQKGRRSDTEKIQSLENELQRLKNTRSILEDRLSSELADKQVSLRMAEKGLVITFIAEVLFNSGKAKLRKESFSILDKVAGILNEEVPENKIGVEGHTDNEPIKHSHWKSNWELSAHRALSVLYYLKAQDIDPAKLSAIAYGEHCPITSNATLEGKQLNRRVEIVILPKSAKKVLGEVEEKGVEEEIIKEEELK